MTTEPSPPKDLINEQALEKGEAFVMAAGLFEGCKMVSEFISGRIRPQLPLDVIHDELSTILYRQLLRAESWLATIVKLNASSDFQAVAAACRSLLEITIDMVLLNADECNLSSLLDWEKSARLKYANSIKNYYAQKGLQPSDKHAETIETATSRSDEIDRLREKHGWVDNKGKPIHPNRWTNRNLLGDVREADKAHLNFSFEHFYETQYRLICWNVHGSGFVNWKNASQKFPELASDLFRNCSELGTLCAEVAIKRILGWSNSFEKEFADLRVKRMFAAGFMRQEMLGLPLSSDK